MPESILKDIEQIPALDLGRLEKIYQLRPQRVLELIDVFLAENAERLQEIRDGLGRGLLEDLHAAAHSVKGSSATLGAQRLAEYSSRLEVALREGDAATSGLLIGPTEQQLEDIRGLLDEQIKAWDAAAAS